jgi:hypothetical protein
MFHHKSLRHQFAYVEIVNHHHLSLGAIPSWLKGGKGVREGRGCEAWRAIWVRVEEPD